MLDELSLRVLAGVRGQSEDPTVVDWLLTHWTAIFGPALADAERALDPPSFPFRVYSLALVRFSRTRFANAALAAGNLQASRRFFLDSLGHTIHAAVAPRAGPVKAFAMSEGADVSPAGGEMMDASAESEPTFAHLFEPTPAFAAGARRTSRPTRRQRKGGPDGSAQR